MTRQQVFCLCMAASFFLHMWGLRQDWTTRKVSGSDEIIIPVDFAVASARTVSNSLALEQASDLGDDERNAESAARRMQREARRQYFQQIHEAIENRRFQTGDDFSRMIGNALYSFRIRPDDIFADVRLRRSSGDPLLDRAAKNAIWAASGTVKRPGILRGQTFSIAIAVKYQRNM